MVSFGSIFAGFAMALACCYICKHTKLRDYPKYEMSLLFLFAYGAYAFAEVRPAPPPDEKEPRDNTSCTSPFTPEPASLRLALTPDIAFRGQATWSPSSATST